MNNLQKMFCQLTGFKNGHTPRGTDLEGWENLTAEDIQELPGSFLFVNDDGEDFEAISSEDAEKLHKTLQDYKNAEFDEAWEYDRFFLMLG